MPNKYAPSSATAPTAPELTTGAATAGRRRPLEDAASNARSDLVFEAELWKAADALRNNMDAAEYKHVVLGLIFLKYISDAFASQHSALEADVANGADPEDPDEYRAAGVFWVPPEGRWATIQAAARQPEIGQKIDAAMEAIERDNPSLKGALAKDYANPDLDKARLGKLVDLISNIDLGGVESRSRDTLGRVYEYFLSSFASAEGKNGGQFYTPRCIVRLLVTMVEPFRGRVYDPACGSGGMFVQSEAFIEAHGGRRDDIAVFGQESNATTRRLARMNLAIRGIEPKIADGSSFTHDGFPDLRADYVLANPPFNDSEWDGELLRDDKRWRYGVPPVGNANFAWLQHIVHHLAPAGMAGVVLANGSMSSTQSGEGEIRRAIIEADLVDCMVALPGQLFYSTGIPACLWFLAKNRQNGRFRDRRGHVLFVDARKLGQMISRTQRDLTDDDIAKIADTYHAWRGEQGAGEYADVPGFCRSATLDEISQHGYVLTPGRYVGTEESEDDGEPFEDKMRRLVAQFRGQRAEAARLDALIANSLRELNYDA